MAALQSEGEAQKLRFGPWLLSAISSGNYPGLCWIDQDHSVFRVPWKHNARKDVTSSDVEIFKAWAKASGRYEGYPEDPAKWKTNFRCALRSTRMFTMREDHSKCGDDPHKVFAINPALGHGEEGDFGSPDPAVDQQPQHQQPQLEPALQEMAPEITLPGSTNPAQPSVLEDVDELQWVLQLCNISRDPGPLAPSWPSAVDAPHQDILLQHHPDPSQNNCLPPPACQQWVPATQQPALGAYSPLDPMLLEHQGGCCGAGASPRRGDAIQGWEETGVLARALHAKATPALLHPELRHQCCPSPAAAPMPLPSHPPEGTVPVLSPGEAMLFTPTHPVPPPPPPPEDNADVSILDVSIYYRGKLFHQEEVGGRQCLLVYQPCDPAVAQRPGHLVRFPSPTELADSKQRELTEQLLGVAGLQLEQRASKLFATRLKKCKVFWALSHQLEGVKDPPPNMLCRDQATPIFDFNEFCTELRDFRNGQRQRSPDFTIYLCFGQFFSKDKPKESRLILVKLVPKFCEYWYEQVQREGASSLDSGTVSLQLSDSFSLFELIEQYTMQMD
ncbi:interferon regulatory factor 7 isoform X1 [Rissa tridactyla]|uniref:interferon regulatory factor 7 isoform X1 n=1 Tax=Rissa tridactyla TaxID=75485 RepID=UPI0023BB1847|nr:interferon regulatory factor 7 isoform X1 [Rissa tridactyla]